MKRSNYEHDLVAKYGEPIRVEVIDCDEPVHPVSGEPMHFVDNDGRCTVCGQEVEFDVLGPLSDAVYSRRARPHTRERQWFAVSEDDLLDLEDYAEAY